MTLTIFLSLLLWREGTAEVVVLLKEQDTVHCRPRNPEGLVDRQNEEHVEKTQPLVQELELDKHAELRGGADSRMP